MKIGAGEVQLHYRVRRETVWYFDSKDRLGKVYVLRHVLRRVQS